MDAARKNVALLAACQSLLFTNSVTLIAINGLAGYALAADKGLATLPVTAQVIGSALATIPASLIMQRIGRRAGFQIGSGFGLVGGAISTLAIALASFWLLCFGTLILGVYGAFGLYYRFAAADSAGEEFKAKAISLVLAGGLVGGVVGPALSKWTRDLAQPEFLASYASLMVFSLISMAILSRLQIPQAKEDQATAPPRALGSIMAQPTFIVAVTLSAIGYGVMSLLMTATPLAMGFSGHPYASAATVISWHVIAMFAPSLITGSLIKRFGLLLKADGWQMLNYAAIPFLAIAGLACLWMLLHARKTIAAA